MKKVKRILISQIFFLIAISLLANKAFFSHIHILTDGKIIVHAHPYFNKKQDNKSKQTNHSHTDFSFCIIGHSNRVDCTPVDFQAICFKPELPLLCIVDVSHNLFFDSFFTDIIDNKGPPRLSV